MKTQQPKDNTKLTPVRQDPPKPDDNKTLIPHAFSLTMIHHGQKIIHHLLIVLRRAALPSPPGTSVRVSEAGDGNHDDEEERYSHRKSYHQLVFFVVWGHKHRHHIWKEPPGITTDTSISVSASFSLSLSLSLSLSRARARAHTHTHTHTHTTHTYTHRRGRHTRTEAAHTHTQNHAQNWVSYETSQLLFFVRRPNQ